MPASERMGAGAVSPPPKAPASPMTPANVSCSCTMEHKCSTPRQAPRTTTTVVDINNFQRQSTQIAVNRRCNRLHLLQHPGGQVVVPATTRPTPTPSYPGIGGFTPIASNSRRNPRKQRPTSTAPKTDRHDRVRWPVSSTRSHTRPLGRCSKGHQSGLWRQRRGKR
jgi:hypothetical protein